MQCPFCSAPGVSLQEGVCYTCGREVPAEDIKNRPPVEEPPSPPVPRGVPTRTPTNIWHVLSAAERNLKWTYTPEEWQQYTTARWRRAVREGLLGIVIGGCVLAFITALCGFLLLPQPTTVGDGLRALLVTVWLFVVGSAMTQFFGLPGLVVAFRLRRLHTSSVTFSPEALWLGGSKLSLKGLYAVTYSPADPAMLRFHLVQRVIRSQAKRVIEVQVPKGHEAEAQQLVRDIQKREGQDWLPQLE